MSDDIAPQRDERTGRFLTGGKAGPGRPKGSRNKFAAAFIDDFYHDWCEHGLSAIQRVREERPADYLRVGVTILPQKIEIERFDNMSEDERSSRIRELAEQLGLAAALGIAGGASGSAGSREEAPGQNEAIPLPTIQ